MADEKDPEFLSEKLERLEKVKATSNSPSELKRIGKSIKKTRKRLQEVGKKKSKGK